MNEGEQTVKRCCQSRECVEIPVCANAWVTKRSSANAPEVITHCGLGNWMTSQSVITVYLHMVNNMKFELYIKCKVPDGVSVLELTLDTVTVQITVTGNEYKWYKVGHFFSKQPGYVRLHMRGVEKSGDFFADVSHIKISHRKVRKAIKFIQNKDYDHVYWSRRGPSVHLFYDCSPNPEDDYYYNEVYVPSRCDPVGSYFVAIGFNVGYFGIQVNSDVERRVLFSVWSPQDTDCPEELTEENKVLLHNSNPDVKINVFGGEGVGGQSILVYDWKLKTKYKFLIRCKPCDGNYSLYTAWFGLASDKDWKLIASFKRPKSKQFLSGFYSFNENFEPESGDLMRKAYFCNPWIHSSNGSWRECCNATMTGDETAKNKIRFDFDGGVEWIDWEPNELQSFYLENGGFFTGATGLNVTFTKKPCGMKPDVDFNTLPE